MLQPHQQRVVDEKSELDEKREKLTAFFEMPMFGSLDVAEQARMRYQAVAMREYSAVLGERIAAFPAVRPPITAAPMPPGHRPYG